MPGRRQAGPGFPDARGSAAIRGAGQPGGLAALLLVRLVLGRFLRRLLLVGLLLVGLLVFWPGLGLAILGVGLGLFLLLDRRRLLFGRTRVRGAAAHRIEVSRNRRRRLPAGRVVLPQEAIKSKQTTPEQEEHQNRKETKHANGRVK